ncbi:MAG: restriction endonuclease PLD domain-containing protein [Balneolaceae bacterium]
MPINSRKSGLSENITVHSIIGRFLEHSRIYYFYNAGNHQYFIGSADWMHRNLDARVEAITPIEQPELKKYLQFILNIYLRDNVQRWLLQENGDYVRAKKQKGEDKLSTHAILMNHMLKANEPVPMQR